MSQELLDRGLELIHIYRTKQGILSREKSLKEVVLELLGDRKVLEIPAGRIEICKRRNFEESLVAKKSISELKKKLKSSGEIRENGTIVYLKIQPDSKATLRLEG